MRAGKLKIKRYKTRRYGWLWILFFLILAVGAVLWYFYERGELPLPLPPAPTLSPEETQTDQRTLTLPGQSWYALQLGVFEQEASAQSLAESYKGRGAAGFIDTRSSYRVLAAAYESRANAQAVQNQLSAAHGVEAYIFEIPIPEITLNVSGQKGQLTTLSDAYDTLHQLAAQLSALSLSLDQGTAAEADIRAALSSHQATVSALEGRLRQLFGDTPHQAVQPIASALAELSKALEGAHAQNGKTRLGAGIKYCQLLCIIRMAEYASLLSAQ